MKCKKKVNKGWGERYGRRIRNKGMMKGWERVKGNMRRKRKDRDRGRVDDEWEFQKR